VRELDPTCRDWNGVEEEARGHTRTEFNGCGDVRNKAR
jgi:hypothetical protein